MLVRLVCAVLSARFVWWRGRAARSIYLRASSNIVLFRPTFSAFVHMYGWTPVHSLSVMLLLPTVFIAWDMQCRERHIYATPSSGDGAGICSSFALKLYTPNQLVFRHTPKMTFSSCYNKWSVGNFGLKLHRHILGTPKANITSCKKGHNRCPLHLHLSDAFIQSDLHCIQVTVLHFISSCFPWESNPWSWRC